MPDTIIIGTGISAAAYLASMARQLGRVVVLGGPHLWERMAPNHAMGQPSSLLRGNLLSGSRAHENPAQSGFMSSASFERLVAEQIRLHSYCQFPGSLVRGIERTRFGGYNYRLTLEYQRQSHTFYCHNLVIASGPGPGRPLMVGEDGRVEVDTSAFRGHVVGGNDFMSPDWRAPWPGDCAGKHVAVYGGSATAAWAVELAALRGMSVTCWFTRPGDGPGAYNASARFREAFPAGGRNAEVEAEYEAVRKVLKLVSIRQFRAEGPFLALKVLPESGVSYYQTVDLLVYALGAAHTATSGIRAMLDGDILASLVAYYDRNLAVSSQPSLLAIGTEDRSLMIVGSAMSSAAGFGGNDLRIQGDPHTRMSTLARYVDISNTLPPAARPTEGIAMVMAGIEALNHYMPAMAVAGSEAAYRAPDLRTQLRGRGTANPDAGRRTFHETGFRWDINLNTSNRTQLAAYLAQTTDLPPFAANLAVALIVFLRGKNVFGLTGAQVETIVAVAEAFQRALHQIDRAEAVRFWWEHDASGIDGFGADNYLKLCVTHLTTGEMAGVWAGSGIRC
jgi:cation diffusion facilitator CzcD-associated flavoprotein CzcO